MVPVSERILAILTAIALLAMLVAGAWLQPAAAGHGTHQQLGMPHCGFLAATHRPCPTCGMTTAVTLAVHRQPLRAFVTQPFGALLALAASIGFWACLHVAIFGSRLGHLASPLLRPRILWIIGILLGISWVYKLLTWQP